MGKRGCYLPLRRWRPYCFQLLPERESRCGALKGARPSRVLHLCSSNLPLFLKPLRNGGGCAQTRNQNIHTLQGHCSARGPQLRADLELEVRLLDPDAQDRGAGQAAAPRSPSSPARQHPDLQPHQGPQFRQTTVGGGKCYRTARWSVVGHRGRTGASNASTGRRAPCPWLNLPWEDALNGRGTQFLRRKRWRCNQGVACCRRWC